MLGGGAARALTNAFPQGLFETLPPARFRLAGGFACGAAGCRDGQKLTASRTGIYNFRKNNIYFEPNTALIFEDIYDISPKYLSLKFPDT